MGEGVQQIGATNASPKLQGLTFHHAEEQSSGPIEYNSFLNATLDMRQRLEKAAPPSVVIEVQRPQECSPSNGQTSDEGPARKPRTQQSPKTGALHQLLTVTGCINPCGCTKSK